MLWAGYLAAPQVRVGVGVLREAPANEDRQGPPPQRRRRSADREEGVDVRVSVRRMQPLTLLQQGFHASCISDLDCRRCCLLLKALLRLRDADTSTPLVFAKCGVCGCVCFYAVIYVCALKMLFVKECFR